MTFHAITQLFSSDSRFHALKYVESRHHALPLGGPFDIKLQYPHLVIAKAIPASRLGRAQIIPQKNYQERKSHSMNPPFFVDGIDHFEKCMKNEYGG